MSVTDPILGRAVLLLQAQRGAEAEQLLAAFCREHPSVARGFFLLGAALHLLGRLEPALAAFERAAALDPTDAQAVNARAGMLSLLGRQEPALAAYLHAHMLVPGDARIVANCAIVLERLGRDEDALDRYRQAAELAPDCVPALLNASALLLRLARPAEALDYAQRLTQCQPALVEGHYNLAQILLALDRYEETLVSSGRALVVDPRHVGAWITHGMALACLGQIAEARDAFERARALDLAAVRLIVLAVWRSAPGGRAGWEHGPEQLPDPRAIYLVRGAMRQAACDWRGRDIFLQRFESMVRDGMRNGSEICDWSLPFTAMSLPLADDVRYAVTRTVAQRVRSGVLGVALPLHDSATGRGEPLRIGYLAPNFQDHPVATLTAPLLEAHDRRRVVPHGYALLPSDGSDAGERFRRSCAVLRDVHGLGDLDIARRIRADGIHILVDLAGYTDHARPEVAVLRPAPIATGLWHLATSASDSIDYHLTDAFTVPPECSSAWTEQLVYLPNTPYVYDPAPIDLPCPTRAEAGLPPQGFVFCCFNAHYKIDPEIFSVWMRMLAAVPQSVLWLLDAPAARENLRAAAQRHGVEARRLVFAPRVSRPQHLARYGLAGLFPDTQHYNAHTTAVEALYAGIPLITCPGKTAPARCAGAILLAAGLPELIVADLAEYERLGTRLASEPDALDAIRRKLARQRARSALFDPARQARALERAYERMWARHVEGLPPAPFSVEGQ